LFQGIPENSYAYFVHSFFAEMSPHTLATTTYGAPFSAALQRDNFFAVQFHPEKSGAAGQRLLKNFLS
jgi:glutamine amidotransferase